MKRVLIFAMAFTMGLLVPASASALSEDRLEMFAQNNILFYNPGNSICLDEADENYDMARNASIVIGELMKAGYSHDSALAIAGNLTAEASFNPRSLEKRYSENKNIDVVEGWRAWEDGKKTYKGGFGMVQWTSPGRVQRLQEYADENNLWVGSLRAQIGFLIKELAEDYHYGPSVLNAMSLEESTFVIVRYYEGPESMVHTEDSHGNHINDRIPSALSELSETETHAAWETFHKRLDYAKSWADLEPTQLSGRCGTSGGGGGGGGGEDDPEDPEDPEDPSPGGSAGEKLAKLAVSMAWPDENGKCITDSGKVITWKNDKSIKKQCEPKSKYKEVVKSLYKGDRGFNYKDCGKFVTAAVKYSLDVSFNDSNKGGTRLMLNYLTGKKGSKKWKEIKNTKKTTDLEPGDVFIIRYPNRDGGHTFIYTENYSKYGTIAEAALNNRVANMAKLYWGMEGGDFRIFRYIGEINGKE